MKSLGGNCYFLTLIDEITRNTWIYLLEKKNEMYTNFKRFKLLFEKPGECAIKRFYNWWWWWVHLSWICSILWERKSWAWNYNTIHTSIKWHCQEKEHKPFEHGKKHAQGKENTKPFMEWGYFHCCIHHQYMSNNEVEQQDTL